MKHLVTVVDGNEAHRRAVSEALFSYYSVSAFADSANAIGGMLLARPVLILVGQRVGVGSGTNFIRDLRREPVLAPIPVIFIMDSEDIRVFDAMRDCGIKNYIVKPYRRSELINAISGQISAKLQSSWQQLPPIQRKALEGTINSFNMLAERISANREISYEEIDKACADIVDVINKDDFTTMLYSVKDHDNFTYVHSIRMATFTALFGKAIGLSKDQQRVLASGGFLHDVGKMTISRALLNKEGRLNPNEWDILRSHVPTAKKILLDADVPKGAMTIVTQHHEKLDGTGYPLGLSGKELNQVARMASIIDIFCALTDRRAYRRALSAEVAFDSMAEEMNAHIDISLLRRFREILLDASGFKDMGAPPHYPEAKETIDSQ
jgi:HD-GYP domain-containing protein (c-di-GMP phosphodiesterase class II)